MSWLLGMGLILVAGIVVLIAFDGPLWIRDLKTRSAKRERES